MTVEHTCILQINTQIAFHVAILQAIWDKFKVINSFFCQFCGKTVYPITRRMYSLLNEERIDEFLHEAGVLQEMMSKYFISNEIEYDALDKSVLENRKKREELFSSTPWSTCNVFSDVSKITEEMKNKMQINLRDAHTINAKDKKHPDIFSVSSFVALYNQCINLIEWKIRDEIRFYKGIDITPLEVLRHYTTGYFSLWARSGYSYQETAKKWEEILSDTGVFGTLKKVGEDTISSINNAVEILRKIKVSANNLDYFLQDDNNKIVLSVRETKTFKRGDDISYFVRDTERGFIAEEFDLIAHYKKGKISMNLAGNEVIDKIKLNNFDEVIVTRIPKNPVKIDLGIQKVTSYHQMLQILRKNLLPFGINVELVDSNPVYQIQKKCFLFTSDYQFTFHRETSAREIIGFNRVDYVSNIHSQTGKMFVYSEIPLLNQANFLEMLNHKRHERKCIITSLMNNFLVAMDYGECLLNTEIKN